MLTRIITAVVALAVFIAVLIAPPWVFTLSLAAVIFIMLYECYSATKADMTMKIAGYISAVIMMLPTGLSVGLSNDAHDIDFVTVMFEGLTTILPAVVGVIMIYMILVVLKHGKYKFSEVLANGFLTLYVVLSMGCLLVGNALSGKWGMLLVFVCAWSTDTFAYFSGKFLGKHKLIAHVSPNKTVEGSIGGVIGAGITCIIYAYIIKHSELSFFWSYKMVMLFALSGSVLSQFGDLAASAIKRDTDIKDFGKIFPGHGGFMDRFDSVMYIAPLLSLIYVVMFAASEVLFD